MSLPIRRQQFDVQGFVAWLAKNGAEVGTPTNPYEVVRYRAYAGSSKRALTHIVYTKESGLLNFQGSSAEHYASFQAGNGLAGLFVSKFDTPAPVKPSKGDVLRAKLFARDGDECWFCGLAMGDDQTIEHLIPKSKGGMNGLANYALAHKRCNAEAADMPLVAKIELRTRKRSVRA